MLLSFYLQRLGSSGQRDLDPYSILLTAITPCILHKLALYRHTQAWEAATLTALRGWKGLNNGWSKWVG